MNNKIVIPLFAACLLSTGFINAQSNSLTASETVSLPTLATDDGAAPLAKPTDDRPWGKSGKFGIYAGVNLSRFVNEPIPDNAYRVGWQAGLYGRTGGTLFGQVGVEYRNTSVNLVRVNNNSTASELRSNLNQHFLAIPAYVGLRVGAGLGLRLQIGAELATLLGVGNNNLNISKDNLHTTAVNGLAGVGINLGPVTVDAVYNHGFANVYKNSALDSQRRLFGLNVGLRF